MGHMFATAGYSSLALLQWEQADGQHAREALLGFVTFASHLDRLPDGQRDTVVLTDIGSSYLRLARLEAEDGNADLSQQYVLRAQESFKAAGRNYSQSDLMKRVSKVVESPHS